MGKDSATWHSRTTPYKFRSVCSHRQTEIRMLFIYVQYIFEKWKVKEKKTKKTDKKHLHIFRSNWSIWFWYSDFGVYTHLAQICFFLFV